MKESSKRLNFFKKKKIVTNKIVVCVILNKLTLCRELNHHIQFQAILVLFIYTIKAESLLRLSHFPFASGKLPVRYLDLPLLTKNMTVLHYLPLIEKIRKMIGSWTGRFLSYAGRLQLINSVISSLANFWMAAFRLPSSCLKEIERLCSAFLWSGPELNHKKAKVAWADLCIPKQEGGLGLRKLKETNNVSCLKLIWRLLS